MMPRKKKKTMIICGVIVFLLIAILICILLYINTDLFKSNQTLFIKYIGKNVDNIKTFNLDMEDEKEYEGILDNNKYTSDIEASAIYTQNMGTTLENNSNSINTLKLNINGMVDNQNKYNYQNIQLSKENATKFNLEYIQVNDTSGIRFSDLFKQFIMIDDSNVKGALEKLDIDLGQNENISLNTDILNEITQLVNLTENERQNLQSRYLTVLHKKISKDKFSKKSNIKVIVNNTTLQTNAYILTLTKEELNNLYITLLETVQKDDIIIEKLNQTQELIKKYNISSTYNIEESFQKYLDKQIEEIKNNNIGQEETNIIVYEKNGQTVKTIIKTDSYEVNMEYIYDRNGIYSKINFENLATNETDKKEFVFTKGSQELKIEYTEQTEDNQNNITVLKKMQHSDDSSDKTINIKYTRGKDKLELNTTIKTNIVNSFKNQINLDESNSIKINALEKEQAINLKNAVTESVSKKVEEVITDINLNDIEQALKNMKLINDITEIQEQGITEIETNRFNAKFELLGGEKLAQATILQVLDTAKENLTSIDIVSDTVLKLNLSRNSSNEELYNTIYSFINSMKNKKYNVEIEYGDNGLVRDIKIEITKD